MALDDLQQVIEKLQEMIGRHRDYLSENETRTRQVLIDPLLRELGWDVENPDLVALEDQPATSKRESADYILKNSGKNVAVVEAKNIDKKIDDLEHLEQTDNYARYAGVQFFVLTNGVTWLLYERTLTTSLESLEPIVRFDIVCDEPHHCALASLSMWNPNLSSGSPSKATEPVFVPPKSASDAPSRQSNEFMKEQHPQPSRTPKPSAGQDNSSEQSTDDEEPEDEKTLILEDDKHKTYKRKCKNYMACLDKCLEILLEIRRDQFERVLLDFKLRKNGRNYFSKVSDNLISRKIGGTDIYVYNYFSSKAIKRMVESVASRFGCKATIE